MNFLAHLWLADQVGADLAGAILGDIVRGRLDSPRHEGLPVSIARSVALHRRIDVVTDDHPLVVAATKRFPSRRYAGIVLDVLYDHVLACDFERLGGTSLASFADRAGEALESAASWFVHYGAPAPERARFAALLRSYAEPAGVNRVLERIAARSSEPSRLLGAALGWSAHVPSAAADLPELLSDLAAEARTF